jgi:hypothetical protein
MNRTSKLRLLVHHHGKLLEISRSFSSEAYFYHPFLIRIGKRESGIGSLCPKDASDLGPANGPPLRFVTEGEELVSQALKELALFEWGQLENLILPLERRPKIRGIFWAK